MQLLPPTNNGAAAGCAHLVLDSVPPVIWFIRRHMRKHRRELSLPQFRTLTFVDRQPALSLSALADHLGSSLPTASRIVAGLVSKGLLVRNGCPNDRRQLALTMTPAGRAVLTAAWANTHSEMQKTLRRLSPAQRTILIAAMEVLRSVFGSAGLPQFDQNHRSLSAVSPTPKNGRNVPTARRHQPRGLAVNVGP